jgi:hypothetical protein
MTLRSQVFAGGFAKSVIVYWGTPVADGLGGRTFDDPVEIRVRWEDSQNEFVDVAGRQAISSAVLYPNQDLSLGGYVYLGRLADLSPAEKTNPFALDGAKEIRGWAKSTSLDGKTTMRKAWL